MYYSKSTHAIHAVFVQGFGARADLVKGLLLAALLCSALSVGAFARNNALDFSPAINKDADLVALSALPTQGQEVYQKILVGGPFQYEKDGTVFGNRERQLPRQKHGFYREYTVPTPNLSHRGARRIVCGGKKLKKPETCFYTKDHYQSFREIDPQR